MLLERDNQNGLEYLTLATYAKKSTRATPSSTQAGTALQTINGQNIKMEPGSGGGSPAGSGRSTPRTKTGTQTSKLRAAAAAAAAAAAQESSMLHGGSGGGSGKRNSLLSDHLKSVSFFFL